VQINSEEVWFRLQQLVRFLLIQYWLAGVKIRLLKWSCCVCFSGVMQTCKHMSRNILFCWVLISLDWEGIIDTICQSYHGVVNAWSNSDLKCMWFLHKWFILLIVHSTDLTHGLPAWMNDHGYPSPPSSTHQQLVNVVQANYQDSSQYLQLCWLSSASLARYSKLRFLFVDQ
jgi:hypothetical protein